MKTLATPTRPRMLPLCIGLSLLASVAASRAADAPARTLDWNRATPAAAWQPAPPALGGSTAPFGSGAGAVAPAPDAARAPAGTMTVPSPRAQRKGGIGAGATRAATGLFSLDDRAIIIVGGKSTTAGEAKRALTAELAAQAGPARIVRGGARKLDLAMLGGTLRGTGAGTGPAAAPGGGVSRRPMPAPRGGPAAPLPQAGVRSSVGASSLQAAQIVRPGVTHSVAGRKAGAGIASVRCPDKELPKISEVTGKLKAGDRVTVWGQCFGELAGRVEIIGQFPGGKLTPAFASWSHRAVEIEVPATVRGAGDHVVAVTIVTADGKTSPAMPGQFVAARERVEVPDRLWSPGAEYELSATAETGKLVDSNEANQAYAGQTAKTLRVQPQCALDTMDVVVHAGSVSQVRGWEAGPPNEAAVTIDWRGTCASTRTTTNYNYVVVQGAADISIHSACRVAFQARAWAYCPLGIAP